MTSTMIPPFGRGVLATGKRVGGAFHLHVLGAAIIRDQLADGDVMVEHSGEKVTRMRTELQQPVPRPRRPKHLPTVPIPRAPVDDVATDVLPVVFPHIDRAETAKLILGIPFRRPLPAAR